MSTSPTIPRCKTRGRSELRVEQYWYRIKTDPTWHVKAWFPHLSPYTDDPDKVLVWVVAEFPDRIDIRFTNPNE